MSTLEDLYGLKKKEVKLKRIETESKKWLEVFPSPKEQKPEPKSREKAFNLFTLAEEKYSVEIIFPEFTCLCPKTSQPDFATVTIEYIPIKWCVELKSLKYYLNSFRNEGHFHEQVTNLIYDDLNGILEPFNLYVEGKFNVRGGTYPTIRVGKRWADDEEGLVL